MNYALNSAKAIKENNSSTQIDINESSKSLSKTIEDFVSSVITDENNTEKCEVKIDLSETVKLGQEFNINVSSDKLIEEYQLIGRVDRFV